MDTSCDERDRKKQTLHQFLEPSQVDDREEKVMNQVCM